MKSEEYLNEIRKAEALRRAVLRKIVIEKKKIVFHLVTDLTYGEEDVAYARAVSEKYVPEGYTAEADVVKSVPSAEGVKATAMELLRGISPAAAAFLTPADIEVCTDGAGGRFFLSVTEEEQARFEAAGILDALSASLSRRFCGSWIGDFRRIARAPQEIEHGAIPPAEVLTAPRMFPVEAFEPIDGAEVSSALVVADLKGEVPSATLCGELVHLEERTTKTGKPYFRMSLRDSSGTLSFSYFAKKATVEKVRALQAGVSICATGANELFNGSFRFTANKLDLGRPPEGYVAKKNYLPVPAAYCAVFPEACADPVQDDLFGGKALPEAFLHEKYVVFDLETTGLNYTPVGGAMDRIIEIGAVKIENGRVSERFSSFIACPVRLSAAIKDLTGISDEMLAGAPEVGKVMADFRRFSDGCGLVAHNASFDSAFIRFYGEEAGYSFANRVYDTVTLAQEQLRLANYKLNTVADHYGFVFRHHRAFDDAFVTAKIFIELVRGKGELPKPFSSF